MEQAPPQSQTTSGEWIECEEDFDSFRKKGLALIGTVFQIKGSDEEFLIGDMNEDGGYCNHCPVFLEGDEVIWRYRVLNWKTPVIT